MKGPYVLESTHLTGVQNGPGPNGVTYGQQDHIINYEVEKKRERVRDKPII